MLKEKIVNICRQEEEERLQGQGGGGGGEGEWVPLRLPGRGRDGQNGSVFYGV